MLNDRYNQPEDIVQRGQLPHQCIHAEWNYWEFESVVLLPVFWVVFQINQKTDYGLVNGCMFLSQIVLILQEITRLYLSGQMKILKGRKQILF